MSALGTEPRASASWTSTVQTEPHLGISLHRHSCDSIDRWGFHCSLKGTPFRGPLPCCCCSEWQELQCISGRIPTHQKLHPEPCYGSSDVTKQGKDDIWEKTLKDVFRRFAKGGKTLNKSASCAELATKQMTSPWVGMRLALPSPLNMAPEELTHKSLIIPEQEHITEEAAKEGTTEKIPLWVGWPVPYHFRRLRQGNHCEGQANLSYRARI